MRGRQLAALALVALGSTGCMAIKKIANQAPAWCHAEQGAYSRATAPGGPFDALDALAATSSGVAEIWGPLKAEIELAQAGLDRACAEVPVTPGSVGGFVATAASLLSDVLGLYGRISGVREIAPTGRTWARDRARLDALVLEVETATGARADVGSRELRDRALRERGRALRRALEPQAPPDDRREIRSPGRRPTP